MLQYNLTHPYRPLAYSQFLLLQPESWQVLSSAEIGSDFRRYTIHTKLLRMWKSSTSSFYLTSTWWLSRFSREWQGNDKGTTRERFGLTICFEVAGVARTMLVLCGALRHCVAPRGTAWRRISIPCFFESTWAVRWGRTWQRCSATTGVVLRVPSESTDLQIPSWAHWNDLWNDGW